MAPRHPWWSGRMTYSVFVLVLSLVYGYIRQYATAGRTRLTAAAVAFAGCALAAALMRYGPEYLPGSAILPDDTVAPSDNSGQEDLDVSEVSESEASATEAAAPDANETTAIA